MDEVFRGVDVYNPQEAFLTLQNEERRQQQNSDEVDSIWTLGCSNFYRHEQDDVRWGRFVTQLQESSVTRRGRLCFFKGFFDRPDEEVLERLFREVLRSLRFVHFSECKILPVYLNMMTTSLLVNTLLPNSKCLQELDFADTVIDSEGMNSIAQMLRVKLTGTTAPPVKHLLLQNCSIDSNSCDLILRALDGNAWLKRLDLCHNQISEISLEAARAFGNSKKIVSLHIDNNPLTVPSICHLAEGLRTNLSLRQLSVRCDNSRLASDAFADLLSTFNYKIRVVLVGDFDSRICAHVHNNHRIRHLHKNLLHERKSSDTTPTSRGYHLSQLSLWPITLKWVGSKPSLIYHFLRHGNLGSFTSQVNTVSSSKKRRQQQ